MFRLIAISLVAAFGLLGLLGAEQPSPYRQAGLAMTGAPYNAQVAQVQAGSRLVLTGEAPLNTVPEPHGDRVAELMRGTPVLALSRGPHGYVRVRDHAGRVGYVPGAVLVSAP